MQIPINSLNIAKEMNSNIHLILTGNHASQIKKDASLKAIVNNFYMVDKITNDVTEKVVNNACKFASKCIVD